MRESSPNCGILISSGGRRVALADCFRRSLKRRGVPGGVGAIDSGTSAPLSFRADRTWRVPRCTDPAYVATILELCRAHGVRLIVPTIDTELSVYAAHRDSFLSEGVTVAVSTPETVSIACNKVTTHAWLMRNDFPTVRQACLEEVLDAPDEKRFPVIAKPSGGSASVGIRVCSSSSDLASLRHTGVPYIVQQIARGREFTANVYVSRSGQCIAVVPHWRLEVRAGEVSKGLTFRDPEVVSLVRRIAEALPGAFGALNVQGFLHERDGIRIIEINARFGGGYPLAHQAGARFTDWLVDEIHGIPVAPFDGWTDDLAMLRYDDAVFVPGSRIRA